MDKQQQPGIRIAQIFLEAAHFEHREDFLQFPSDTPVSSEIDLTLDSGITPDGQRARIRLAVRPKLGPDSLYRFDVVMTALVEAEGEKLNFPLGQYARSNGWALLFPFVREFVANITSRGRFGPLWLKPINFFALAARATEEEKPSGVAGALVSGQAEERLGVADAPRRGKRPRRPTSNT